MKKLLLALLLPTFISAMDLTIVAEQGEVNVVRSKRRSGTKEDDDIARMAIFVFFDGNECEVIDEIREKLRHIIVNTKNSDFAHNELKTDNLNRLKHSVHPSTGAYLSQEHRRKIRRDTELKNTINEMVMQAIQEYGQEKEREIVRLDREVDNKERHKRIAIGVGILTTLISAGSAIAVAYIH